MATTTDTLIFELEVRDEASPVFDSWDKRLKKIAKDAEKAFDSIGSSVLSSFTGMLKSVGSLLTSGFLSIFGSLADIVKSAFSELSDVFSDAFKGSIDLEDAMSGIRKTAGLTADETFQLTEQVRKFSIEEAKGRISAEELAAALEIAGQQGVLVGKSFEEGSKDALAFAKTMVMAGKVFDGLSIEKAAEGIGLLHGAFSDFIPDVERTASVINFFGDTTKRGEGFILRLAGGMAEASKQMGLTEAQTISIAATLGNINQVASKSGTAMSGIFKKMRGDSREFAEAFGLDADKFTKAVRFDFAGALVMLATRIKELSGTTLGTEQILQGLKEMSLTGQGVSNVMLGLGNNVAALVENLKNGTVEWDLNTSAMNSFIADMDRTSQIWEALGNIWDSTAGQFTDVLLPTLKELLTWVNNTAVAFSQWVTAQGIIEILKESTMSFWKDALKPMLDSFVEWVKTSDTLRSLFAEIIPAAIETAMSFVSELAVRFDELFGHIVEGQGFVESFLQVFPEFQPAKDIIVSIANAFKILIKWINESQDTVKNSKSTWSETFSDISEILAKTVVAVNFFVVAIKMIGDAIEAVRKFTEPWFDGLVAGINVVVDLINGDFLRAFDGIENIAKQMLNNFISTLKLLKSGFDKVFDGIEAKAKEVFSVKGIIGIVKFMVTNVIKTFSNMKSGIDFVLDNIEASVTRVFSGMVSWISGKVSNAIDGLLSKIKSLIGGLKETEDVSHKNSVFPDMLKWIQKNQVEMGSLASGALRAAAVFAKLGTSSLTAGTDMRAAFAVAGQASQQRLQTSSGIAGLLRQPTAPIRQSQSQSSLNVPSQSATSTARPGSSGPSVTVNLNGTNIVDESSRDRFVRSVSAKVISQSRRVVRAG